MFEEFILRALFVSLGIACVAGVLGCFVVWRKMAYFGDSLSHSALLGVALGIALGMNTGLTTIGVCIVFSLVLWRLQQKKIFTADTLLGIMAHSALSLGVVVMSLLEARYALQVYLFGDILLVSWMDVGWVLGVGAIVFMLLVIHWQKLVLMTLHEDLARAEGIKTEGLHFLLLCMLTLVVAMASRVVGILLVTSLLVIPAATARQVANLPETMAFFSVLFAISAVCVGILLSVYIDVPPGPTVVVVMTALFICVLPIRLFLQAKGS